MKKAILIVAIVLLAYFFLAADIYVKSMEETAAFEMMGEKKPGSVKIKETWLGDDKFIQKGDEVSIIVDSSKQKVILIIHHQKVYIEFPMDIEREKLLQTLGPKAAEVISSIKITDVIVDCDIGNKKVANWDCHGCEFEMTFNIPALNIIPKYRISMWMTEDVPFNYEQYSKGMEEFFQVFFRILDIDEAAQKEFEKMDAVKGFQVAAEVIVNIFGTQMKMTEQVLEVIEKKAPPGTYEPPKDYTEKTIAEILGMAENKMPS